MPQVQDLREHVVQEIEALQAGNLTQIIQTGQEIIQDVRQIEEELEPIIQQVGQVGGQIIQELQQNQGMHRVKQVLSYVIPVLVTIYFRWQLEGTQYFGGSH